MEANYPARCPSPPCPRPPLGVSPWPTGGAEGRPLGRLIDTSGRLAKVRDRLAEVRGRLAVFTPSNSTNPMNLPPCPPQSPRSPRRRATLATTGGGPRPTKPNPIPGAAVRRPRAIVAFCFVGAAVLAGCAIDRSGLGLPPGAIDAGTGRSDGSAWPPNRDGAPGGDGDGTLPQGDGGLRDGTLADGAIGDAETQDGDVHDADGGELDAGRADGSGDSGALPRVTLVEPTVIAHGGSITIMGEGLAGTTMVLIGGVAHPAIPVAPGAFRVEGIDDTTPIGAQTVIAATPTGPSVGFWATVIHLVVNEVDATTQIAADTEEAVEIATGVAGVDLADYVLVFYDGADDRTYLAVDLSATTDGAGLLVVGNASQAPDRLIPDDSLASGPAAVAIHQRTATPIGPGTMVTAADLIDAVVYRRGFGGSEDRGLLDVLLPAGAGRIQNDQDTVFWSLQRCDPRRRDGRAMQPRDPTIGLANDCP